jgi:hypothetical protein
MKEILIKYKLIILGFFLWYCLPIILSFINPKSFSGLGMFIFWLILISTWLGFIIFVWGIIKLFKKKDNTIINTNSINVDPATVIKSQISEIFGMTIYILLGISLIIFSPVISANLSNYFIKDVVFSLLSLFVVFIPIVIITGGFFIFFGIKKLNRYLKLRKQINNN